MNTKPYTFLTLQTMRGKTRNRLMTLGTLRLNVMTRLFNAIGRGEDIRTRFEDLVAKYDAVIKAETEFYKYMYETIQEAKEKEDEHDT